MSSAPGSVIPSPDQPPPCATKKLACVAPDDSSGCAKWYAPRMSPALVAPSYCDENVEDV
jgi:hypothetical protein